MASLLAELAYITVEFFFWMMLGRLVLGLLSAGRTTFFTELFRRATYPVVLVVRKITPGFVPDPHIPLLSLPLLLALRILLAPVSR
jgi:uncharacterized protein YggT (Ycf19 family)